MSRLFAIADIHGRFDLLDKLLKILINFHNLDFTSDKLVFTGDYIDRGSRSFEVLEELYHLNKAHPNNVICLLGNHEQMMLDWHEGRDKWGLWLANGGIETLQSFDPRVMFDRDRSYIDNECPKKYLKWLKKLPLFHEEPGFFFSHAPLKEGDGLVLTKDDYIWTYWKGEESWAKNFGIGTVGVCGHIHALNKGVFEPRFYDHYIYADAGCGCHPKAPLCAINVRTREVVYATS